MGKAAFLEDSSAKGGGLAPAVLVLWIAMLYPQCHCQSPRRAEPSWAPSAPLFPVRPVEQADTAPRMPMTSQKRLGTHMP